LKYLLDTDHISVLQRRSGSAYAALATRITQHTPADFAFSVVSFHEHLTPSLQPDQSAVQAFAERRELLPVVQSVERLGSRQ